MTSFDLSGKTALVTGGSRGIGAAIVKLFAEHGATVGYCHYGDNANAAALQDRMSAAGYKIAHTICDVSREEAVHQLKVWSDAELGHVDILVNCAGIGGDLLFEDITIAEFDRQIGVHLRGTFMVTKQFYSPMAEKGWGRIINVSSQLAYKGAPGQSHYCAAKAGIVGFTRALSYEAAPKGVTVNSIAPGPVETDMLMGLSDSWRQMKLNQLPAKRFGRVNEIAPTALLLASDEGSFFVGQTLSPNGGDIML
ncbi:MULTISPECIES: SDR family NAD(P)-dependent oxidoreductase [Mesorhizobium]|uniref:3-oxoacyl-[acyl-carrier protein] reductase n=1 Tax=Mesorhizobium qingshengii TaxID=1165689 RepID=A0A1G5ZWG5_9HYPH|nr:MULTISPECIES: 3-oxoacyl-ACP reductase family protein [Mesorhizobium]MCH4560634.1 3-oxoacyl-ACP reductase FabG [Mesorhizobium jarvisii]QGU21105.1 SDR family oxidoreductase [Mesorhizobium huakuii 7653R]SDA99109.1 3-oxoacyl-[acyl-carrier protein] reductase [Mesorhizobium qingshengii]